MSVNMKRAVLIVAVMWVLAVSAPAHAQVQVSYAATNLPNTFTAANNFSIGLTSGPLTLPQITALTFVAPGTIITCSNCTTNSNPCTVGAAQTLAVYLNGAWTCNLGGGGGGGGSVNPGTQYQLPIYATTGSVLSADTLLTDNGTLLAYTGATGIAAPQFGVTGSGAFTFGGTYGNFSSPGANLSRCGFGIGGVFSCSFNNDAVTAVLRSGGVAGTDITTGLVAPQYIGNLSATYVTQTEVASASGVASLDTTGNVPANQLGNVMVVGNNYALFAFCSGNSGGSNSVFVLVPSSTGTSTGCSTTTASEMPIASAGTMKNLYVNSVHAGSNASNVVLYVNGSATAVTCSIASSTTCSDTTHTVAVSQGSTWSIRYAPGGTSDTAQGIHASFQVAVSSGYTEFSWCPGTVGTANAVYALLPVTSSYNCASTVATEMPIPVTGTATNLYVNAGTQGSNASNVTLYINGAATALTCSIGAATTCNDQIHQIPFNAGNTWSVRYAPGAASDTAANIQVTFQVF